MTNQCSLFQVVVLGNLLPLDAETDELDSWMYQTVGHQLIGAYAAATGLPLLRRHIYGSSIHTVRLHSSLPFTLGNQLLFISLMIKQAYGVSSRQELSYAATEGDEVEDLAALVAAAKLRFPDLQGVTSGAIASDYQRLRVEAVRLIAHARKEHCDASPN